MDLRSNKYWATEEAREVVRHMEESRSAFVTSISHQGLRERWRKSYNLYYGNHYESRGSANASAIMRTGAQGELAAFAINHYRNLIKHTLTLTVNQKPAFDVRAINTDYDSLQQARLGNNILESDYKFKHLGSLMRKSAEMSQVFGKGFVCSYWNTSKGKPYSVKQVTDDDGQPMLDEDGKPKQQLVYEGDIEDRIPSPWDVYVDQGVEDWRQLEWVDVRLFENKWNLAARYPKFDEEIRSLPVKNEIDLLRTFTYSRFDTSTDQTPVHYFFHKRTLALPNGRLVIYCSQDVILYDGPAPPPYDETLPVFRIVPGEVFGTTEGWTDAFDLQGIQEAIDVLISIGFTNLQANGTQKIWVPDGANISTSALSKGLAIIKSAPGMKPEPLQLSANPQDLYPALNFLVKSAESISGINSVARGDPEHSLKSGIALAYVQAMAAQYTSAFQEAWAQLNEEVGTFRLKIYKEYAGTPRLIAMAGKRNKGYMSSFTGDKLKNIDRVVVEIGNPLTKTLGGRIEVADNLMDKGQFKTPQDYLTFIETGNFDTLTDDGYDQIAAILQENEMLMEGKKVQAVVGEKHLLHIQKHFSLIENPAIKHNAPIVQGVLDHIQEHMQTYKSQDPLWSMISGEPPAPQPAPPPPPPGAPQGPGPAPAGGPPPGGPPPGGPGAPPPGPPHHPAGHGGGQKMAEMMQPPGPGTQHIPRLPPNLQPGAANPQMNGTPPGVPHP